MADSIVTSIVSSIVEPLVSPLVGKWGGSSYVFVNAEAAALVARFTTPATEARKPLIDNLVGALKTAGVWAKSDALYIKAAETAQAGRQNWIQNLYNLSALNSPTFTADRGYKGDGSTSYLSTNFTPSTAVAPQFTQNNGHVSFWGLTSRAATDGYIMGAQAASARVAGIWPRGVGDTTFIRANDIAAVVTNANSNGFFIASRTGATARAGYRNGTLLSSGIESTTTVPTLPLYVLAYNNGTPQILLADQGAVASIGAGLTSTEVLAFYNAVLTYLQAVGAA
jgi:hypothetical protein